MKSKDIELIEKWEADESFINWAQGASSEDVSKWNHFFSENPELRELAELAIVSIDFTSTIESNVVPASQSKAALESLKTKISSSNIKAVGSKPVNNVWKVVIGLAVAALLTYGLWSFLNGSEEASPIQYASQEQIKSDLFLEDGSEVTLNKFSTILYDQNDPRSIELRGEAFFNVSKDLKTNAKFLVTTQDLVVEVLGTQFNVFTSEESTQVYLREGSINLRLLGEKSETIQMEPGDFVTYSKKNQVLSTEKSFDLKHIAWKEGIQYFEESDLTELVSDIEKLYNVSIDIQGVVTNVQFTGGIPTNNLDIALETLRNIYQVKIKKENDNYILRD